jgi:adenylate cyclase
MAPDVEGYSQLMAQTRNARSLALKAIRRELANPKLAKHRGRIAKTTGDGLPVEFPNAVDAARARWPCCKRRAEHRSG